MTDYKKHIYDYVNNLLVSKYKDINTYFGFVNKTVKQKSICLLKEVSNEPIHRTSESNNKITEFMRSFVTISISLDSDETTSYELANEIINYIRSCLSSSKALFYFQDFDMSPRQDLISSTRDLTNNFSGNFVYKFEFDIPFDYISINNNDCLDYEIGKDIDISINISK